MYRSFRTPSLWRDMDRLQQDMNRLFSLYSPSIVRRAPTYPAINIWVSDASQFVTAEMPGVHVEDIDINVDGDTLTISGELGVEEVPAGAHIHRKERSAGKFSRTIQLPYPVDADKVEASFKNGILSILLPHIEAVKPKKITITS
jgi:HSP20 family protein